MPSTAQQSGIGMLSTTGGGSEVTVSGTLGGSVTSGIVTNGCVFFICTGVVALLSGGADSPTRAVSFFGPWEIAPGTGKSWTVAFPVRELGGGAGGAGAGLGGGRFGKLMRTGSRDSSGGPGGLAGGRGGGEVPRTGSFLGSFGSAIRNLQVARKLPNCHSFTLLRAKDFRALFVRPIVRRADRNRGCR